MADREKIAHLLRRATFGPTATEVDDAERAGYSATLSRLLRPQGLDQGAIASPAPVLGPDPVAMLLPTSTQPQRDAAYKLRNDQIQALTAWWPDRMVTADHQWVEKLIFFWHGHWATNIQKVDSPQLMLSQHQAFRFFGRNDFAPFVKAMLRDPALILWLDGQRNAKRAPNENLARELMELFVLGIGNYSEADVKAAARALTGWQVDRRLSLANIVPSRHDTGSKQILGETGVFDVDGLAELLLAQPANAQFLAKRFWFRFASGEPASEAVIGRLVKAYGPDRDITSLAQGIFTDPDFAATRGKLVKQPLEWICGAMRQLDLRPATLPEDERQQFMNGLKRIEQVPFRPPSVGGWPSGAAWLTSHSMQSRIRLTEMLSARAPKTIVDRLAAAPVAGRIDALGRLLVVDAWTDRTRKALTDVVKDSRKLLMLGLVTPEYLVH
ncbi:uncharacterized protein (DUF1800 family) [Allocatelliglobosispora scoriae]|uniref:Uncharacterized protein (DUF1800 family) n=1 Tax=Allocatelliglobosispora scoriae TaxID=643052 RepID=A0A841BNM3_9ACTN|nr:DUF1800 domain-containing protein [Allocatelliglobosispora scoriae]MBB5870687.1 uncharacterized protein (DUF1800 family) [Allocatelliglobosispora scoriae]